MSTAYDRTLGAFFRSLTVPARRWPSRGVQGTDEDEWLEQLRASGGQKQLEFYDRGLTGSSGAMVVLKALEQNPKQAPMLQFWLCDAIILSQNGIGDNGLREILVGLKRLRPRDVGNQLADLNLSGCSLTDVSLHLIALHLLQPNPHKSSLTSLYMTANRFTLSAPVAAFLGAAISASASALRCLALTNNPIGTEGALNLLNALNLSDGPSNLTQLHLSVCGLTPDAVEPLAQWLESPKGAARRLQVLCVNGNSLSDAGVARIRMAVASGKCTGLLHLEAHANQEYAPEWEPIVQELRRALPTEPDIQENDRLFELARKRNMRIYSKTRFSALAVLAIARVLMCDHPIEYDDHDKDSFPFLRLPEELQMHVLRHVLLQRPISAFELGLDTASQDLWCPLTEAQFTKVVNYASSRQTLAEEIRLVKQGERLNSNRMPGQSTASVFHTSAWIDYFLHETSCDVFMP